MDDEHTLSFFINAGRNPAAPQGGDRFGGNPTLPNTTDWFGRFRTVANPSNDFHLDRELQRSNRGHGGYSGIDGGAAMQDAAITWSMGTIYNRSREHLGTTDLLIIRTRRRLLGAIKALRDEGVTPPGVDDPELYRVRSGGIFLPWNADWVAETEELRKAFVEHSDLDPAITGDNV